MLAREIVRVAKQRHSGALRIPFARLPAGGTEDMELRSLSMACAFDFGCHFDTPPQSPKQLEEHAMNKKEIAARLASRASITNVKAQEILNHLFDAENGIIGDALSADDQKAAKVLFAGFGTFERRTRAPRAAE